MLPERPNSSLCGVLSFEDAVGAEQVTVASLSGISIAVYAASGNRPSMRPFSSMCRAFPAARETSRSGGWPAPA